MHYYSVLYVHIKTRINHFIIFSREGNAKFIEVIHLERWEAVSIQGVDQEAYATAMNLEGCTDSVHICLIKIWSTVSLMFVILFTPELQFVVLNTYVFYVYFLIMSGVYLVEIGKEL